MHRQPSRHFAMLALAALLTSGCASYEVTQRGDRVLIPLETGSTEIVWQRGKPESLMVKQEKGYGVQKPVLSNDEKRELAVIRQQVYVELAGNLIPRLKSSLGPYVQREGKGKYVLNLELNRVVIDADGTRDVTITATLSEPPFAMEYWTRKVRLHASRFNGNDTISANAVEAIVAQLRSSALIR